MELDTQQLNRDTEKKTRMAFLFDWQVIDARHRAECLALKTETGGLRTGTQIWADGPLPWWIVFG